MMAVSVLRHTHRERVTETVRRTGVVFSETGVDVLTFLSTGGCVFLLMCEVSQP